MTTRLPLASQVTRIAPAGSLLKRPQVQRVRKTGFRTVREKDESYLDLIRQLPCLKCGMDDLSEPAHVRYNSAAFGKRQAVGAKPDDKWTLPLCAACHRNDSDSQHRVGERDFWHHLGINPLLVCQELQKASPNVVAMRAVAIKAIASQDRVL